MVDTTVSLTDPTSEAEKTKTYKAMLADVMDRESVINSEWIEKTKEIYDIYEGAKADQTPFNILYSNTEILIPNVFSQTPRPVVSRRFGEQRADDASQAAERMAEYCMDTNLSGYPDFVDAIEACVLDSALPGQGQARVRMVEGVACLDYVQHDKFIWAWSRRWEDCGWIAYRHDKTIEDAVRTFNITADVAAKLVSPTSSDSARKGPPTIPVYEVWNKQTKKVYFLTDALDSALLSEPIDDPLQLSGFFPSGKPLRLLSTPVSTMPRPIYNLYKQQALELNNLTYRIRRVVAAIKVRGIYDGNVPEMATIFMDGDQENALVAASNPGGMSREGGLDKHIWLIPTEKLVVTLQNLYQAREQVKSTIYEILGIGDILRGVSAASETASAQRIKDKWGSLRIKKARDKVSTFVRWHVRAIIELAAKHTPEDVWAKTTGLPFMTAMQSALMPPAQPGPDGQMPLPQPTWADVLQTLQSDLTRSYTIDIETNSTVDSAATEDKEEAAEFMTALGQSTPIIEGLASQGPTGVAAAKAVLVSLCKRFRMGTEVEKALLAIVPKPPGPTPEQAQKDQELQKKAAEVETATKGLEGQQQQLKDQFRSQQDQIQSMIDELERQKRDLQKASDDLERKKQTVDHASAMQAEQGKLIIAQINVAKANVVAAKAAAAKPQSSKGA